jgi:two-component system, NarL family, sensor histidine kinase DesK
MVDMDEYARRGRRWGLVFAGGYLAYLIPAVYGEGVGPKPVETRVLVLGALGLFVAGYVWYWLNLAYERRLPRETLVLLVGLCAIATGITLYDAGWLPLFIYCVVVAGASSWDRRSALALVLGVLVLSVVMALLTQGGPSTGWPYTLGGGALGGLSMLGIGFLLETNFELRQAREEVGRLAVAEERLRFARDLHDLLGHSLSVIVLKSELAGRLSDADATRAAHEIRDVERVAREALREVREAVAGYRQLGLGQELESARATLSAAGIEARFKPLAGGLPTPVDSALAWALREGITNVIRHSAARHAEVRIERSDDHVELELLDDGVGCDGCDDGNGLRGLRERVAARAGTLVAGTRTEGGFRLAVSLPLRDAPRPVTAAAT